MTDTEIKERERDPAVPLATARRLLATGSADQAMAYFWHAGEGYARDAEWESAGDCLSKAAYCRQLQGRLAGAAADYRRAAELYLQGGCPEKAEQALECISELRSGNPQ